MNGQPVKEQYITTRVTPQEKEKLMTIAEREGRTLSQICRRAIQQFIRRRKVSIN